jgi:hypothetical protein
MSDALTEALVPQTQEEHQNYLELLVGEGKKFKTVEDLAKSKLHADKHIADLQEELEELRQHKSTMDEVLAELRKSKPTQVEPDPATVAAPVPVKGEDVTKIVDEHLSAREKQKLFRDNTYGLMTKLIEKYGSKEEAAKAVAAFHQNKEHLKQMLDNLGGTDPDEAFALITNRTPAGAPAVISNTPGAGNRASADSVVASVSGLTWSAAKKIKKENPAYYKSKEFQDALVNAAAKAQAQGKDFFAS